MSDLPRVIHLVVRRAEASISDSQRTGFVLIPKEYTSHRSLEMRVPKGSLKSVSSRS